jgi:Flp pilus assembly protein CpaB
MWHRRKIAALCAAVTVFSALNILKPPPAPSVVLIVARHDLSAGSRLQARDIIEVRYPRALAPAQALETGGDAVGRFATSGIARGTPLTALSLSGGAAWYGLAPQRAAVPARLQDGAVVDLLRPGQHVRLTAVDPRTPTEAEVLVDDAIVLAVPAPERTTTTNGRLVVFDVPASRSNLVASSAVSRYLTVTWGY